MTKKFFAASAFLVVCGFSAFLVNAQGVPSALAGYFWSEGAGWVSLNCANAELNECATSSYAVTISSGGDLAGHAWSSNVGWISFNSSTFGACPTGSCAPKVNLGTGKMSGWARACSVFASGCSGALADDTARGSWDGWISLSGAEYQATALAAQEAGSPPAARADATDYAWGADVLGWLESFVTFGEAPPSCALTGSGAYKDLTLSWTSADATSGSIDNGVGAAAPIASGSKVVAYPAADTTYTMTVQGSSGAQATCNISIIGGDRCTAPSGCSTCTTNCCGPTCAGNTVSCTRSPSDNAVPLGATVTFTATPSGTARNPYRFTDANGATLQNGNSPTYTHVYSTAGDYQVNVSAQNATNNPAVCGPSSIFSVGGGACAPLATGVTLTASPNRVVRGGSSTIAWSITQAKTSCVITNETAGAELATIDIADSCVSTPQSDSVTISNINAQTTVSVVCDNDPSTKKTIIVNLQTSFQEF